MAHGGDVVDGGRPIDHIRFRARAAAAVTCRRNLTADEIAARDYVELIREPGLGVVLFRRQGWAPAQYSDWADRLLHDQVAFIPPTATRRRGRARC